MQRRELIKGAALSGLVGGLLSSTTSAADLRNPDSQAAQALARRNRHASLWAN